MTFANPTFQRPKRSVLYYNDMVLLERKQNAIQSNIFILIQNLKSKDVDFFFENYNTPIGKLDLSLLFIENSITNLNQSGYCSFITSSQWMQTDYGKKISDEN